MVGMVKGFGFFQACLGVVWVRLRCSMCCPGPALAENG